MARRPAKPKPDARPPARRADADDDRVITALKLAKAKLTPAMQAYFDKCTEKLGFVPNVLKAYAFDMPKLEAFVAMYNDLMLARCGLTKLEREMIAVAVSSHNRCYYCLTAHGAAVRALAEDPVLGELMVMNYRAARLDRRQRAMLDFAVKLTAEPWAIEEADRKALRDAGFSDRDIWDIAAVTGFFNMSNRVASATDMRPNRTYHGRNRRREIRCSGWSFFRHRVDPGDLARSDVRTAAGRRTGVDATPAATQSGCLTLSAA